MVQKGLFEMKKFKIKYTLDDDLGIPHSFVTIVESYDSLEAKKKLVRDYGAYNCELV